MILLILTSHRLDCFDLCVKCLEAHTNLQVFEKIYVLGNELAPAHKEYASAFTERHSNAELVEFGPRGWPPLMAAQDELLKRHPRSIMVKIDEDVFVMPRWLEEMLLEYKKGQRDGCVLVSALVPNNQSGMRMLHDAYLENFPDYSTHAETVLNLPISKNPSYALWVWNKFLQGKLNLTPEGLLKGKKVYMALARGGRYRGADTDTQTPYLKMVFGFLGMTEIEFIYAEGLNMGPEAMQQGFAEAEADLAAALT